jgi:hypothetical protein
MRVSTGLGAGRGLEQALLVGGEHAPRAVHAVEHHAADADELERVARAAPLHEVRGRVIASARSV